MIELNTEKCIFQLIKIVAAQRLINGRRAGKVEERQRERMCVRASVGRDRRLRRSASTNNMGRDKHMGNIFRHKECGGVFD